MTSSVSAIDGVTFDLDGTLYDHGVVRWPLLLRNVFRLRVLRVGHRVREELRQRSFDTGALLLAEEARVVGERLGVPPVRARALLDAAFERSLSAVLKRHRHAGSHAALAALAARLPIAVVSDRRIDDKLAALGLLHLPWAAKVSADDTGALKPSPRPFLLACQRMGIAPARALHIGDRDDTDGEGARAAGLCFRLVGGPSDLPAVVAEVLALDADPLASP